MKTDNDGYSSPWSNRGIFVFGSFPIDLQAGYIKFAHNPAEITDCSDKTYYCMKSSQFNAVLPRKCSDLKKKVFRLANASTTLLYESSSESANFFAATGTLYADDVYLFNSPQNPDIILLYTKTLGVTAVFFLKDQTQTDKLRKTGFDSLAAMVENKQAERYNLVTFDTFGVCK